MKPTKNQHYVPRVYLKSWKTGVETSKEPLKKFNGVYCLKKGATIGEGISVEAILWKPHLYTINFRQIYLARKCPKVCDFFADEIYNYLNSNKSQPIYGKLEYSIINNKKSIKKYLNEIDDWEFYYNDGSLARKKSILNHFYDLKCYLLEESFDKFYESKWNDIRNSFINEVKFTQSTYDGESERKISMKVAEDMLEFFFMMLCRSPGFNAMGIYSEIGDILRQCYNDVTGIDDIMDAVWFVELYRIFYKEKGGFYHSVISNVLSKCQFILFEAYPNAGSFITSDNPAFMHLSKVDAINMNAYYFPISPKYLLLIVRGDACINVVDYRMANSNLIKKFNQIIYYHSYELIISTEKKLGHII